MKVRVLAFARIREIVGVETSDWDVSDGASVGDLWNDLGARYPALVALGASTRFARDGAFVSPGTRLVDGDEIAFLPPFGGG